MSTNPFMSATRIDQMLSHSDVVNLIADSGLAVPRQLVGCSSREIGRIAEDHQLPELPADYSQFLSAAGKECGRLLQGTDFKYPELLEFKDQANELLIECGVKPLPAQALVIAFHQGYTFACFLDAGEPDPFVSSFDDSMDQISTTNMKFVDWLKDVLGHG